MLSGSGLFYRPPSAAHWVLRDHHLEVPRGEVTGLRGPSGCGKSTLAAVLAGLITPNAGEVRVDGDLLGSFTGARPVQVVLQRPDRAMNPRWKIREVLAEALPGRRKESLEAATARVHREWDGHHGLVSPGWLDRFPHEISGGELQRVNLVRALWTNPRYLLADEISASLDAITQTVLWHRITHEVHDNGLGVLAISHDTPLLEQVADRIIDFPVGAKSE